MFSRAHCCAVALALAGATPLLADVVNGSFDLGTTSGWTSSGPVFVVDSQEPRDFLPPPAPDWLPTSGPYFAELWSTDLHGVNSAFLEQTFSANAGNVLYFDCFYDYGDVPPYYDPARITLTPYGQSGADLLTFNTGPSDEVAPAGNVGWLTVAAPLDFGGLYTLHLEISDADGSFESILGIDNVRIVPEPGTLLLSG
ncbi:MAG: hypothetical protein HZB38_12540, partial [Planctomycetes bacterium]|nr:hypothetical protein [Planctomycetota bacterium]